MAGFAFEETMRGSFHLLADPTVDRAAVLRLRASVSRLRSFVRDKTARIEGTVDMEGFATERPLSGTLGLHLFDQRRLVYAFHFAADDGTEYSFRGQSEWRLSDVEGSLTVLPASLYDTNGVELGRAVLRFDARSELRKLVGSFKVTLFSLVSFGG
jgi:hypothetical protein